MPSQSLATYGHLLSIPAEAPATPRKRPYPTQAQRIQARHALRTMIARGEHLVTTVITLDEFVEALHARGIKPFGRTGVVKALMEDHPEVALAMAARAKATAVPGARALCNAKRR